jgi:hypothetical protein
MPCLTAQQRDQKNVVESSEASSRMKNLAPQTRRTHQIDMETKAPAFQEELLAFHLETTALDA